MEALSERLYSSRKLEEHAADCPSRLRRGVGSREFREWTRHIDQPRALDIAKHYRWLVLVNPVKTDLVDSVIEQARSTPRDYSIVINACLDPVGGEDIV